MICVLAKVGLPPVSCLCNMGSRLSWRVRGRNLSRSIDVVQEPDCGPILGIAMACELTINRVGAFSGLAGDLGGAKFPGEARVVAAFRELIDRIEEGPLFDKAINAALAAAAEHGRVGDLVQTRSTDCRLQPSTIIRIPANFGGKPRDGAEAQNTSAKDHLVGLLPSKKFECEFKDRRWFLRLRASFTACALEGRSGLTKLWLSFEGIAADPNPDPSCRPTDDEASKFIAITDEMERAAMHTLHAAYRDALFAIIKPKDVVFSLRPNRLRVSMADNDRESIAALLDAMYFDRMGPTAIKKAEDDLPKKGLRELEHLVGAVSENNAKVDDKSLSVTTEMRGVTGVVCQYADRRDARDDTCLVGFARRDGIMAGYEDLSPSMKRKQKEEEYVRSFSGARPLSAMLANTTALDLERQWHSVP